MCKSKLKYMEFCDKIILRGDCMIRLKRKNDDFLIKWKDDVNRLPLIVKGARQIGKTDAIKHFAVNNYKYVIEINFVLQKQFKDIFIVKKKRFLL